MPSVEQCLDSLESICEDMVKALVQGDTTKVNSLVFEQCKWVASVPKEALTNEHGERFIRLKDKVLQQQTLVEQALRVSQYFLEQLHQETSYSALG